MRLAQYTRAELAIVSALVMAALVKHTTRMKPRDIAMLNGTGIKTVYRALGMAERNRLILRNRQGEVILAMAAIEVIKEAFNGLDDRRRKTARAR